jgi:hypothetical protein
MSFLTIVNGRIETDSSTQLGELIYGMGELGKRKKKKKKGWFKKLMPHKLHMKLSPFGMLKKKKKKKGKKKRRGGGGGDEQQEQSAVDTGAPPEGVVPAALQPPGTDPFQTSPGPMSPATYPMAPMYPSPMQPPMEYPSSQFPQAFPSGGGGGEQPYYEPQQGDSMPQFINTEEESKWQPPTPMYEGPSAYEADPGQRGMEIQQSGPSPFNTGENEFASGADPGDGFPQDSAMSGYLVSGGSGSWEDQGWGGMAGEYDAQIQELLSQAQVLRGQGQESLALSLEDQARALAEMQANEEGQGTGNWLMWGGIALGLFLLFGKK